MSEEPTTDVPPEVRFAVSQFAPYMGFEWTWHVPPIDGNYDPNAALSATLHIVEMATVSSPTHIALYRNGNYSGQGTPIAGAFVSIRHADCTDDTVAIRLKIPGDSHVDIKSTHDIDFKVVEGQIYWSGDWPFDDYAPPIPGWAEILEDDES